MHPFRWTMLALAGACALFSSLMAQEQGQTPAAGPRPATILVEAEGFQNHGGWVVDQQVMDQMGSPFLLAHGLGVPVADAVTTVALPAPGTYRVLVRTRDWVAPWKASGAPGRFQMLIDGRPLPRPLGTDGADWHWQDAGSVTLAGKQVVIALHDLTGFDGRCDAIVLTTDAKLVPPNQGTEMAQFRRRALNLPAQPPEAGKFDLVVVGGGMAGTCAAISAARLGLSVALVQDRPMLGGNNSSEVRVGLSGNINLPPYPALGNLVKELAPIGFYDFREARRFPDRSESQRILRLDPIKAVHNAGPPSNYEDDKKLHGVQCEKNIRLFLNMHVFRVEKAGNRIRAAVAKHTQDSRELRFSATWFADCTGDGTLGYLAGADHRVGREGRATTGESLSPEDPDRLVMGTSVQWYAVQEASSAPFPECPWAMPFTEETCQRLTKGDWDWETGMNRDQIADFEQIRDHALRVTFGNWSFLKNHALNKARYDAYRLAWVAYIGGKRESRRLLGDVILCQQDIEQRREFPDRCVTATWHVDLHYPSPANTKHFPGQEFRSIAKMTHSDPYAIPYRCLYSRNVENLFMAGRNISVTHVALGKVRVQKTTGMMGEVVGMAASLCKTHDTTPRGVYQHYLADLQQLLTRGVEKSISPASPVPKASTAR